MSDLNEASGRSAAHHAEHPRFVNEREATLQVALHEASGRAGLSIRSRPGAGEEFVGVTPEGDDFAGVVLELEQDLVPGEVAVVIQECGFAVGIEVVLHVEPLRPHRLEDPFRKHRAHAPWVTVLH